MPGSVQYATPTTVLPLSLSSAFSESREYPLQQNTYAHGESQRAVVASDSRKRFRLSKRLTPSQISTLWTFYEARQGGQEPFYFYHPYETVPKFFYDPTGTAPQGRYTVRFEGAWEQQNGMARSDVQLTLVELA